MQLLEVLNQQIYTTQFNSLTSVENKKDMLLAAFKQLKQKQNIFKSIINQPMKEEIRLQIELDDYRIYINNMTQLQLDDEFEKLLIEESSFKEESKQQLKEAWGL